MATEVLELQVRATGTKQTAAELRGIADAGKLAAQTMALLRNALVLVGAVRIGQGFVEFIDKFDAINDKVKPFTQNQEQLKGVLGAIGVIAQRAAQPLGEVADVYTTLARSTSNLGLSQNQVIAGTQAFTNILVANGRSLSEANTAVQQFGLGLQSGALSGRALTSILKNAPPIANAIAKEFGVAAGQLQGLVRNNPQLLETSRVFKALGEAGKEAEGKLGDTVDSISDGFQRIGNAALFFFGRLAEATGVGRSGLDFLTLLADNIDKVVLAIAGLAALGTVGFVLSNLITIFGSLVGIVKTAIATITLFVPLVTGLGNAFLFVASAALAFPAAVLAISVAIAGLIVYLVATGQSFYDLIPAMSDVVGTLNVMIAAFTAGVVTIVDAWNKLPDIFAEIFEGISNTVLAFVEGMVKGFLTGLNKMSLGLGDFLFDAQKRIDGINFGRLNSGAAGTIQSIGATFTKTFDYVYKSNPVQSFINFGKEAYEKATTFLGKLKIPGAIPNVLGGVAAGAGSGGSFVPKAGSGQSEADKVAKIRNELESALGKFDPYIKGMAEIDKLHTMMGKNAAVTAEVLARFGITREEAEKRIIRDIAGVGNAVVEMQGKMKLLDEAQKRGAVTAREYAAAQREIFSAAFSVVDSISPLIAATAELENKMKSFDEATAAGANLGIEREEVLKRLIREQVGVGNAAVVAADQTALLNKAWEMGAINADEFEKGIRKIRLAALEGNTDAVSGFQRGIIKVQDEYQNLAKDAENTFTNMFDNLQSGLEEFFSTGKLNFSKLIDGILADLTKLAIKGAITGPLSKLLGGGGYNGSTGAETDPFGGIFSAITGGFSSGAAEASNTVTTGLQTVFRGEGTDFVNSFGSKFTNEGGSFLDGLFNIFSSSSGGGGGGGGGGLGGIFDFIGSIFGGGGGGDAALGGWDGTIPGFDTGGSMMVDGQHGRDRNLAVLRVSRGERIDVATQEDQARGGRGVGGTTVHQNFVINTPDADSFRRSQGQIGAMAAQGLQRASSRNG